LRHRVAGAAVKTSNLANVRVIDKNSETKVADSNEIHILYHEQTVCTMELELGEAQSELYVK
jgi:hypothetical protein